MNQRQFCVLGQESFQRFASGQQFVVKDLFTPEAWNALTPYERFSIGKHFKLDVIQGRFPGVIYLGKSLENTAQYKKL